MNHAQARGRSFGLRRLGPFALGLLLVLLALLAPGARAAQLSFVSSFQQFPTATAATALTIVDSAGPYSVPAFNPTLGTLTGVAIRYSTTFLHDVGGQANATVFVLPPIGPVPSVVQGDFASTSLFKLEITEPGAQSILYSGTDAHSLNCTLVAIAPGCQVRQVFTGNDGGTFNVPAPLLGAYVSQPGDTTVSFTASDQLIVQPSCSAATIVFLCRSDSTSLFNGSVTFTYTYEPVSTVAEPASAALWLAGCGLLAAWRACRARGGS